MAKCSHWDEWYHKKCKNKIFNDVFTRKKAAHNVHDYNLVSFSWQVSCFNKKKTNGCASHTTLLHNNIYFLWSGVPTLNSSYIHGRHFNMGQNVHPAHVYRRESQFSVFLYPSIMKQWIENSHAQKKELEG